MFGGLSWSVFIFTRCPRRTDREDRALRRRCKLAGPGIILYVFVRLFRQPSPGSLFFASLASTIYGFLFVIVQLISSMSLMIAVLVLLSTTASLAGLIQTRHLHDLGKRLLAFVMLWPISVFPLLIIWSGNVPEEISFYLPHSLYGGWGVVAVLVLIFPFLRFFSSSGTQAARQKI